jgi:hypothetical protein
VYERDANGHQSFLAYVTRGGGGETAVRAAGCYLVVGHLQRDCANGN